MIFRLLYLYLLAVNLWAYGRLALEAQRRPGAGMAGLAAALLLRGRRLPAGELRRLAWLGAAPGVLLAVRRFRPQEATTRLVRTALAAAVVEYGALLFLTHPSLETVLVEALGMLATALGGDLQVAFGFLRQHLGLP
ncbi:MAG: hypothetical protein QJR14_05185 [Bacillota bacterium]|nr:hypothetical protein [Bacillota bacterium]